MKWNKTALVTGGSSGIGKGIAIVLAKHGYDVAITYGNNQQGAEDTYNEINALGRKCFIYQASLEDVQPSTDCVKQAIADLGHLTLLVNNAGRTKFHSVLTITAEEMQYLYDLNFRSYILASGEAARHMVENEIRGSIIFNTSVRGNRAFANDILYGSLKAALNRAAKSMALDLAPYGIRVNCIAPGATAKETFKQENHQLLANAIPLSRMGTPKDCGELVAFLACEDKSGYITGVTIEVDGGLTLPGMVESSKNPQLIHSQTDPDWFEQVRKQLKEMK